MVAPAPGKLPADGKEIIPADLLQDDAVETAKIKALNITEAKLAASMGFGLGVLRVARAKYDFDVDGGAQSAITLAENANIPDNAIIVGGIINSTVAVTSGGAGTVSIGTLAGSSATSIIGVTAKGSLTLDDVLNSDATFAAPVKMTAASVITATIGTADLTAGVIEITILYFVAAA